MNARRWVARRTGTDVRVRCMRGEQVLLECHLTDTEAHDLVTQLDVARHVPAALSALKPATDPVPPSRL